MVTEEVRLLKTLVSDLEKELKSKGKIPLLSEIMLKNIRLQNIIFPVNENSQLEAEVRSLQRKLIKRDGQILKQERELHKLKVEQNSSMQHSESHSILSECSTTGEQFPGLR